MKISPKDFIEALKVMTMEQLLYHKSVTKGANRFLSIVGVASIVLVLIMGLDHWFLSIMLSLLTKMCADISVELDTQLGHIDRTIAHYVEPETVQLEDK